MIQISEVKKRKKAIYEPSSGSLNMTGLLETYDMRYNYDTAIKLIENSKLISEDEAFVCERIFDIYEDINENNPEYTDYATQVVCNELGKFKFNPIKSIKNRLGRLNKGAARVVNKVVSKAKTAVGMQGNTDNSKSNPSNNHEKMAKQQRSLDSKKAKKTADLKHQKLTEGYQTMIESYEKNIHLDRVWKTHININHRFNTNKIYEESCGDLELCVDRFCALLDTYDVPFRAKVNICLENILYEYDIHNKQVDKEQLATAIAEYFTFAGSTYNDQMIKEETKSHMIAQKIFKIGQRLAKHSNTAISSCGEKIVKAIVKFKDVAIIPVRVFLDLVGILIGGIFLLWGVSFVVSGIICLLINVLIGICLITGGAAFMKAVSPTARDKFKMYEKSAKDDKLKRALKRLNSCFERATNEDVEYLQESFCYFEYLSNMADIEHTLKNNKFYNESEIQEALNYLKTDFGETVINPKTFGIEEMVFGIGEAVAAPKTSKAKAAIAKLRNLPNKSASAIKDCITACFADSPENIIEETPNLFRFFFTAGIVLATIPIHLVLTLMALMVSYFIKIKVSREQVAKYIKKYKAELARAEKKQSKMKDGEAKKRNEEYIKELKRGIEKLETYEDSLHTEEENDKRKATNDDLGDDSDSDFGSDDDFNLDDELKEQFVDLVLMDNALRTIVEFKNLTESKIYDYMKSDKARAHIVTDLTTLGVKSEVLDPVKLRDIFEDAIFENRKSNFVLWEAARAGKAALEEAVKMKDANYNIYQISENVNEMTKVINEMNIVNQLSLLIDAGKRKFNELSDKEKVASRTLDTSLEKLRASIGNSLRQENKEAVIRGDILPPASRIIKLALVSGLTFLVHPALTVIYLVGVFAMSRNLRVKERQIVLDELETELKVCDEYIEQAKQKKDMNAYRNCLNIKKKLTRQRDRLSYKCKIEWNTETPDRPDGK